MRSIAQFFCLFSILIITSCGEKSNPDENNQTKIFIQNLTLFEGDEDKVFTPQIFIDEAIEADITVEFTTEDDTAEADKDYIAKMGIATIPAGETNTSIEINVIGDIFKETDESFKVQLSNPTNAILGSSEAICTIRNEDDFVDVPEDGYITPESYGGYTLNWQDEFNGSSIDLGCWTHEIGNSGWGNNELQYYTNEDGNSYLSDGSLIIEAKEEDYNGAPYTSARLITKDKKTFTHGRVDIRAILPEGQGIWPALWMLGNNISEVSWPACGEIDIMELVGHKPSETHGTAHWGNQGSPSTYKGNGYSLSGGAKFSDEFHVFSLIWEPNKITWFVDDNQFYNLSDTDVNGNYPFNAPFFFIFNIAVGGNWPGYPDASTQFPQKMIVDYIRVFDKN
ncbi:family 16 glycosylhydrolase [Saprospiraceae bacterium]|nr:family 16 glycosylhydrolase [Saprospiraceae bacterium]